MIPTSSAFCPLTYPPDESDLRFPSRNAALIDPFHEGVSLMFRTSHVDTNPGSSHLGAAISGDPMAWTNRKSSQQATRAAQARQVSGRRRLVDPTTSDRDYSEAELEFMQAIEEYKLTSGRMFPTWSEVLEVLRTLGYEQASRPV
jgi:hypothetical protein